MATKYNTFTTPQPFRLRWSVKLQKKVTEGAQIATTDYQTGFQYLNGELQFFPTAEGYVKYTYVAPNDYSLPQPSYDYVYNHTDHLGNIRISYTQDPNTGNLKILEENNYYPFGLKHGAYNSLVKKISADATKTSGKTILTKPYFPSIIEVDYNYKYQGQERQNELNLNWDSFKWRNYDYAIGRFMSVDPLSEKYSYQSHYNFAENRVIEGFELEGLEIIHHSDVNKAVLVMPVLADNIISKAEISAMSSGKIDIIRANGVLDANQYLDQLEKEYNLVMFAGHGAFDQATLNVGMSKINSNNFNDYKEALGKMSDNISEGGVVLNLSCWGGEGSDGIKLNEGIAKAIGAVTASSQSWVWYSETMFEGNSMNGIDSKSESFRKTEGNKNAGKWTSSLPSGTTVNIYNVGVNNGTTNTKSEVKDFTKKTDSHENKKELLK